MLLCVANPVATAFKRIKNGDTCTFIAERAEPPEHPITSPDRVWRYRDYVRGAW